MRPSALCLHPQDLLLGMPPLVALAGLALLGGLSPVAPAYLALLTSILAYGLLVLFGPSRHLPLLRAAAPAVYALLLLGVWGAALFLLPEHPATPVMQLASVLHLNTLFPMFFVWRPARVAVRHAVLTLAAFLLLAWPQAWPSLVGTPALGGGALLFTLLLAYGPLLLVLWSFSQARDQLAQAQAQVRSLDRLAHCDPLTNLHNRRALEQDLDRAVRENAGCLLAVIDVDGLKRVNDTWGHAAGDDLLRRFASGFASAVGPGGRAYRLSGDEFALLLTRGGPETAQQVVDDVTREVRQVYGEARASVGTARPHAGETGRAWLSRADRAMYRHKKGRCREAHGSPVSG